MSNKTWNPVYIGIGSNMEQPKIQVLGAIEALRTLAKTEFFEVSQLVLSPPMGVKAQDDFVNAVAAVLTQLAPIEMLDALQEIENQQGRVRTGAQWGPRVIDLDILVYADQQIDTPRLKVPHPHVAERNFVLGPLSEIAPYLNIPGVGHVDRLARKTDLAALSGLA